MTFGTAIVLVDGEDEREVVVNVADDAATLADVLLNLGSDAPPVVTVDGRSVPSALPVAEAGLVRGAVVDPTGRTAGEIGGADATDDQPSKDGTIPWRRPPRLMPPPEPGSLPVPERSDDPPKPDRPGVAALVMPVLVAAVTALVWNPIFAIFALVAPVVSLATWGEGRRRYRSGLRSIRREHSRALLSWEIGRRARRRRIVALRRTRHPAARELMAAVESGRIGLWERRPHHRDFMLIAVGRNAAGVPVTVRIAAGAILGVVGQGGSASGVARALLTRVVLNHGPADCRIAVVASEGAAWEWVKWLPHVVVAVEGSVVGSLAGARDHGPDLVVVEAEAAAVDPLALERFTQEGARVIVMAGAASALPGSTDCIVDADTTSVFVPSSGRRITDVVVDSLLIGEALGVARRISRFFDPELVDRGRAMPQRIGLGDLLTGSMSDVSGIARDWKASAVASSWSAPVAVDGTGVFAVDLVEDGPHALVAGTTGAGKSEFLRTLVASLAASIGPDRINFVLVDYKGGSAFDACARLPHTVGVVTDLDEGLAERALVCLDAELRHRELRLREAGAADIGALRLAGNDEPLPRLVIVVDEFAALAGDLPDFMASLVDIAQRGRSLGVHLVLATQRPAGVVDDKIRANTNLRVALRVQTAAESVDVVGTTDAANLDRRLPGRAIVRIGQDDPRVVQAATIGAVTPPRRPISWRPFEARPSQTVTAEALGGTTDLERLVATIGEAATASRHRPPRRPWPDPLPVELERDSLASGSERGSVFGLADDPSHQRIVAAAWAPEDGHLLLFGVSGSGTTNALAGIVAGFAKVDEPPDVYVIDCDDQRLAPLRRLPFVGAVVGGGELGRQRRALRMLVDLIEDRRSASATGPRVVVVVDGLESLLANFRDEMDGEVATLLVRIATDGPGAGVALIASAKQPSGVPHRIASLCPDRLAFRLVDRFDYRTVGCDRHLVDPPPGRAIRSRSGLELQVARCDPGDVAPPVESSGGSRVPPPVEDLAVMVRAETLGSASNEGGVWTIPLGLAERSRRPALLVLRPGEDALVAGRRGSGRTTTLVTIARAVAGAGGTVAAVAGSESPLAAVGGCRLVPPEAGAVGAVARTEPDLLLIDDAEMLDDPDLANVLTASGRTTRVVAAGDAPRLRGRYGHWSEMVRHSGAGVLLQPERVDGDLLGVLVSAPVPAVPLPGRGLLVSTGRAELIQVAMTR